MTTPLKEGDKLDGYVVLALYPGFADRVAKKRFGEGASVVIVGHESDR